MQSNPNENFVSNHLQEKGKTKEKGTGRMKTRGKKIFSVGNKERDARKITGDTFKKGKGKKTYFKVSLDLPETLKTEGKGEKRNVLPCLF